jgi:hypothetical protein
MEAVSPFETSVNLYRNSQRYKQNIVNSWLQQWETQLQYSSKLTALFHVISNSLLNHSTPCILSY